MHLRSPQPRPPASARQAAQRPRTLASAADWHARISANVDDYYADRISYEEFGRRNRALWDAIAADGKQDEVSRLISRDQKAAGLFAHGLTAARVRRADARGRVVRRYAQGGATWLLVEVAPGMQLSWPEAETRPVSMAWEPRIGCRVRSKRTGRTGYVIGPPDLDYPQKVRVRWDDGGTVVLLADELVVTGGFSRAPQALQLARPSDFRAGDRVVDEHGLQGTVVGPGAGGTRVVIQWDDGSSSNLSAVDLERWGVEKAQPTLHARRVRAMATRRPATLRDAEAFRDFRALHVPFDEVRDAVGRGAQLEIEESGFKDAGSDYTALYLDGRAIGRMEGYSRSRRRRHTMAGGAGFKAGDRIELLDMPEDPNPISRGTKGTVDWASDVDFGGGDRFTQVSVRWDNGRSLMLSIPPDRVRRI